MLLDRRTALVCAAILGCTVTTPNFAAEVVTETPPDRYADIVKADEPIAYWRFQNDQSDTVRNVLAAPDAESPLDGTVVGKVSPGAPGPQSPDFPLFGSDNLSVRLPAKGSYVRIADPGADSPLDFDAGDAITIEAWVNPKLTNGRDYHYIIGKGRTNHPDFARDNQNWALRLQSPTGTLSFLFRSRGEKGEWHRWTSKEGLGGDSGWHHVAVTYTFGEEKSLVGYIDGRPVKGVWDSGGATDRAPVVDDDEVRIGSTFHGGAFGGALDEVALYRQALAPERIAARYRYVAPELRPIVWEEIPDGTLWVDIFEGLPNRRSWEFRPPKYVESFTASTLAFVAVPKKYDARGLQQDRSNPFLLRAAGTFEIPAGTQQILLRSRNAARLYLDGRLIAETKFHSISSSAHGRVFDVDTSLAPNIRPLRRGDTETVAVIEGDGKRHHLRFEMIVGGQGHRPEFGETSVSIAAPGEDFRLVGSGGTFLLTDEGWTEFKRGERQRIAQLSAESRQVAGAAEAEKWAQRHAAARDVIAGQDKPVVPEVAETAEVYNDIDRFILARLEQAEVAPAALADDYSFLRRAALDVTGTIPSEAHIAEFQADQDPERRSRAIDRLLAEPGWADNWMGYWQDVLAENPSLVKPKLNNSGPFRFWLHESLADNKPFDRFVTELIRMDGSRRFGGPAGFAMATQNDVPMAAKAQIIGRAFLGLNMTCARCHDAPFHDHKQQDLFALAAMLDRKPLRVPKTSSVPGDEESLASMIVEVTLKPGSQVAPAWTFSELIDDQSFSEAVAATDDSRERLAALITSPHNARFAEVIVNRMWKRYFGRGLVEPVDDWHSVEPSHPELLQYLARELVLHDYDLKHIARLILNSRTYQSETGELSDEQTQLFAGQVPRRMSAEQLVDSMFAVAGKPLRAGQLCLDPDGAMKLDTATNLGEPLRAWEFASLSNERDRPSLALPFAQPFVTFLETFGWRSARQNPITERDDDPTVRQPAVLANGVLGRRMTRLSDDSAFTRLAQEEQTVERLVERVYLRVLTRKPTAQEQALFVELLSPGYVERLEDLPQVAEKPERLPLGMVSWSNHLSERANAIKIELQRAVERGDIPTSRLNMDWRERMEDMLWALMNSPEFVYLP